jgi:hypothetical protein
VSAAAPVACAGAPRDLGLDQGAAVAAAVRDAVARLPWRARLATRLGADARAARCARDALCHYPHASERLAGLARAAGASRAALAALLARELAGGAASAAAGEALAALGPARPALLARSLAAPAGAPAAWLLRRSAPEHDWRSLELTLPWLVPALAGVNERGLAALGVVWPAAAGALEGCAAPALLLVQECLQRCDTAWKAVEWCRRRPSGGSAVLLLADAAGGAARVDLDGDRRRVVCPRDGVSAAAADAERAAALEKVFAGRPLVDADALAAVLAAPPAPGAPPRGAVVLDPAARTLSLRTPDARWTHATV